MPTVAIIAPGAMGAALGGRLGAHGVRVLTSLAGRGGASAARARAAGMVDVEDGALADADILLSVLPPSDALGLAERLAPSLASATRKPVYADCNAVSPDTVRRVAALIGSAGCPFVDVGIIGPPPKEASSRTVLYCSGEQAGRLAPLAEAGLMVRRLAGEPVGAASALKMAYAGITKGLTALGAAMALAGSREGLGDALANELNESQPDLAAWLKRQTPGMFDKAYRWSGEMREIAAFLAAQGGPAAIYEGMADLYNAIAGDVAGDRVRVTALEKVVARLHGSKDR